MHNEIRRAGGVLGIPTVVGVGNEEEGVIRLGETLTPVLNIHELPELQLLNGVVLWGHEVQVAAVAAELAFCGIRNASSDLIVVVCGFGAGEDSTTTTSNWAASVGVQSAVGQDAVGNLRALDQRHPTGSAVVAAAIVGAPNGTVADPTLGDGTVWGGNWEAHTARQPRITLPPTREFRLHLKTVNRPGQFWFWGYLRNARPGELS